MANKAQGKGNYLKVYQTILRNYIYLISQKKVMKMKIEDALVSLTKAGADITQIREDVFLVRDNGFHGFLEEVLLVVFIEVSACDFKLELPALSEEQLASFVEVVLEGLKLFDHVIGQA